MTCAFSPSYVLPGCGRAVLVALAGWCQGPAFDGLWPLSLPQRGVLGQGQYVGHRPTFPRLMTGHH